MIEEHYGDYPAAMYHLVHNHGLKRVATKIGMNPGTLQNKVNPAVDHMDLRVPEAIAIMHAANDFTPLAAICRDADHNCFPMSDFSKTTDGDLIELMARREKEDGEAAGALLEALTAHRITSEHAREHKKEAFEAIAIRLEIIARIDALAEAEDKRSLKAVG